VDRDITSVQLLAPRPTEVGRFLTIGTSTDRNSVRQWYSARAELAFNAHFLEELGKDSVRFEPSLPNGKRADAAVKVQGRWIWVEYTALSDADVVQDSFDPTAAVSAQWGDPYADAQRIYRKAFDKIAGPVLDQRTQLHPIEPSVLVVLDAAWMSPGVQSSLGGDWALAQLTDPAARSDQSRASLVSWAEHDYGDSAASALAHLASVSAVTVGSYDLTKLTIYPNLGSDDSHKLSLAELEDLGQLFQISRPWLTGQA
jgi:hypothetical protein